MNEEQAPSPEEAFTSLLAACDEALAAGSLSANLDQLDVAPEVRQRLVEALPFVRLLNRLRPDHTSTFALGPGGRAPSTLEAESAGSRPLPPTVPFPNLGRFQVVGKLGEGAYGVVFLAYDPHLGREVALKVPRAEALVTPDLRARFEREARAAAGLDHPNLVAVHEAGSDGPICYIASAYCPGITLAQWLKERSELVPLPVAAALVAALADGVQHAHERGVVHRDLKPGNILLPGVRGQGPGVRGEGPGASSLTPDPWPLTPVPRITDFGLAKFLAEDAEQTQSGAILGTPAYMAPEQAGGKGRDVGPAADIYALGAILYELLTGRPPFLGENAVEILMRVRADEPVPPGRLRSGLPRDLETVCLKCLEKEPARRYAAASELAADLRRFLAGEPVAARPVGRWERARKWARRRPTLAALMGVIATAVVALVTLGICYNLDLEASYAQVLKEKEEADTQRRRAEDSRRDGAKEQRRAEGNLAQAMRALNKFHIRLSEDYLVNQPGQKAVRRALLQEAAQLYRELIEEQSDSPIVREELAVAYVRLAVIVEELEGRRKGIPIARQGLALLQQLAAGQPTDTQVHHLVSGLLSLGRMLLEDRQIAAAELHFDEAIARAEGLTRKEPGEPAYARSLANAYTAKGSLCANVGRVDEAEKALRKALDVAGRRAVHAGKTVEARTDLLYAQLHLGAFLSEVGERAAAEALLQKGQAEAERLVRERPVDANCQRCLVEIQAHLGQFYRTTGQLPRARALFERARDSWAKMADEHPDVPACRYYLAQMLHSLGEVHGRLGDDSLARAQYMRALALVDKLLAADSRSPQYQYLRACIDATIAFFDVRADRTADALPRLKRALATQSKLAAEFPTIAEYRRRLAEAFNNLGGAYKSLGQRPLAVTHYEKALAIYEPLVEEQPRVLDNAIGFGGVLCNLGHLYRDEQKGPEALRYYGKAQVVLERARNRNREHLRARFFLRNVHLGRARALTQLKRYQEALADWERVFELDTVRDQPTFLAGRALTQASLGDHAAALADIENAAGQAKVSAAVVYDLAAAAALASAAVRKDERLAEADREATAARYAARAVELLTRARKAGYFTSLMAIERLRSDGRFDAVRKREDYRQFADTLHVPGKTLP